MSAALQRLPPTHAPSVPGSPERIGRYELDGWLGSGSMGVVYRAHDPELRRHVALKILRPDVRQRTDITGGVDRKVSRERFAHEARAMAAIVHPHVVPVYDVGTDGEQAYFTMELVEGPSLTTWLEQKRDWADVVTMFVQAGRGLAAAHAMQIVHRDFKPDNVLIAPDARAKVMDFGLATQIGEQPSLETTARIDLLADEFEPSLTQSGMSVGTPAYMAPEQHWGDPVDGRADQFAFCSALWCALHEVRPWQGASADELAKAKQHGTIAWGQQSLPRAITTALLQGMAPDPEQRHSNMETLLELLQRAVRRRRITRTLLPFV